MTNNELIKKYPKLYHMAESGTWESIKKHGLLSTVALLDLFEIHGEQRAKLLRERRPDSVLIDHPLYGKATIRDNKVLQDHLLEQCLSDELSPADWYEMLNSRVFFWPTKKRLETLITARPYRSKPHCVLEVDTAKLLECYEKEITLSPINSGNTLFNPAKRGKNTFALISGYDKYLVAEFAVNYRIPDIEKYIISVKEMRAQIIKVDGETQKKAVVMKNLFP